MTSSNIVLQQITAEEAYYKKKIKIAKIGMFLSWISAVTAIIMGVCNSSAVNLITEKMTGTKTVLYTVIIAITILGVNDIICGVFCFIYNAVCGKGIKEFKRMVSFKLSWLMLLAAIVSGPLATGLQMASYNLCGITYTTAVLGLTPVLTAVLGRIVFKEHVSKRSYIGILFVFVGVLVSCFLGRPEEAGSNFSVGIMLACFCPLGFSLEGMISTYAGDLIDPLEGCAFYRSICSGILGLLAMRSLAGTTGNFSVFTDILHTIFSTPIILFFVVLMVFFRQFLTAVPM